MRQHTHLKKQITMLALTLSAFIPPCGNATEKPKDINRETQSVGEKTQPANNGSMGIRFKVENVEMAKTDIGGIDVATAFNYLMDGKLCYMPEEHKKAEVHTTINNQLLSTIAIAYAEHHPLTLSPDEIWLTICQGMALHINQKFKKLEPVIYKKGHPKQIEVRNDTLKLPDSVWKDMIDSISVKTATYTGHRFYEAFVPQFSTTTPIERVVYQITLLHAQQQAYDYIVRTACGIPYITLLGTTEDWKQIKSKLSILNELGLKQWKKSLDPIIDQFISASEGKVDADFWQNIYKDKRDVYDAYAISGWIHKLYPYIIDIDYKKNFEQRYKPNPFLDKKLKSSDYLTSNRFPNGTTKVPITWKNLRENETKELWFVSGFMGLKQYKDKTLEPFISWAIYTEYPE